MILLGDIEFSLYTVQSICDQTKCTLPAEGFCKRNVPLLVCVCVVCGISEQEALWPSVCVSRLKGSGLKGARGSMK